ncbi:pLS20_p028 family conjugation system transmembrane protein, partial [Streptococcus ovis]|uniref:pLS20_p028 family conjugation system transmembrane protein n=1 Tax=Streptococcus ovis TaxID=82806 RepID=UPI000373A0F3
MTYDSFSDLMSNFKDLHREIPATDPRSAPLVEFYKYWSNYLEPTPAYMAFLNSLWGTLAKGLYFITASLEHVFNNLFKLFGLFGYLGNQETIIGQFFYWFQLIGTTLFTLILVTSSITGVFTKPVKYKGAITNFLLVTFVSSVMPMALTAVSTTIAQDAQNIQTVKSTTEEDSSYFSSLALQPMKNNVVDLKVLIDNDFSTELFHLDDHGFIKPPKEGSTPVNNITDSPDKRDTSDFASRIDFSATFGATDSELLDTLEKKQKGMKGLFLHQLNATQDGILTINEHKFIGQLNAFEPVYKRYKVNWIGMFAQYAILIVLLISMAIKLVKSIFDIVIQALISPLVGYTSLSSSKKYKELLRTAGGALAGIFFEVATMRVTMEILRDLPTLSVSAVTKFSGGYFDGLNMWEQCLAACVVYIGVFLAAMQGVTMIERWLGVSTGHSDTAQQLIGAMMAGQAFATG